MISLFVLIASKMKLINTQLFHVYHHAKIKGKAKNSSETMNDLTFLSLIMKTQKLVNIGQDYRYMILDWNLTLSYTMGGNGK